MIKQLVMENIYLKRSYFRFFIQRKII